MTDGAPNYGRTIETKSFVAGKVASTRFESEESIEVHGTMDVLSAIGNSLKEIGQAQNHRITFEVVADHKTLEPVRIIKRYMTERKAA